MNEMNSWWIPEDRTRQILVGKSAATLLFVYAIECHRKPALTLLYYVDPAVSRVASKNLPQNPYATANAAANHRADKMTLGKEVRGRKKIQAF